MFQYYYTQEKYNHLFDKGNKMAKTIYYEFGPLA